MTFRKILVAIDRSLLASKVFAEALTLAQKEGSRLIVFYCLTQEDLGEVSSLIETEEGNYLCPYPIPTNQQLQLQKKFEQIQEWLQAYCQKAITQGVPTEIEYRVDEVRFAICDLARSWGADLIILGRRGRQGLTEALLGSVSNHVVHHAPCSVLVIQ